MHKTPPKNPNHTNTGNFVISDPHANAERHEKAIQKPYIFSSSPALKGDEDESNPEPKPNQRINNGKSSVPRSDGGGDDGNLIISGAGDGVLQRDADRV